MQQLIIDVIFWAAFGLSVWAAFFDYEGSK